MKLFGKKKDEEEFDEEEDIDELENEEKLENRRLRRKLKDLNPENKKKRREPAKPWGKKERWIVGGFFLATTIAAMTMFLYSHDFKLPGLPRINFKGISLTNPFAEEIIELGQKSRVSDDDKKAQKVITFFTDQTKPLSGHYGFLVIRLGDGVSYGVSSNNKFQGASLLKLPLMTLMYRMSEDGELDLDTKYILTDTDKVKGSGVLYSAKVGTTYSYRKLAEYMGKNSDRTAYKVIKDVVGETRLTDYLNEIGMINTDIFTGETTPNDIGILLQKLWNNELTNESDKTEILSYLTDTAYEGWIVAGVPKDVTVAHKFGVDRGVVTDGGIIENDEPYVFVIMGQGITESEADNLFPKISNYIYKIESDTMNELNNEKIKLTN